MGTDHEYSIMEYTKGKGHNICNKQESMPNEYGE